MAWLSRFGTGVHRDVFGLVPLTFQGSENVEADRESRNTNDSTERSLSIIVYNNICQVWGPFQILVDVFASRLNFKVPNYLSWRPDSGAKFTEAFSFKWGPYCFYAFSPFSLIALCLKKIEEDLSSGVLLVPLWATLPWFPVLLRALMDHPRILPNSRNQHHSEVSHPVGKKLKLLACLVSGEPSSREAFQKQLPQLSCSHGQTTSISNISHISQNGSSFAVDGKVIHMTPCRNCIRFLGTLHEKGLKYSTLNTARSAVSAVVLPTNNQAIGNHPLVSRFMRGIYKCNPPIPRYQTTWNVQTVLTYLSSQSPVEGLDLKLLTLKLLMLIALVSAQGDKAFIC